MRSRLAHGFLASPALNQCEASCPDGPVLQRHGERPSMGIETVLGQIPGNFRFDTCPKPCRLAVAGIYTGSVDDWLCYIPHQILGEAPACICPSRV